MTSIVGWGHTRFGKLVGETVETLIADAAQQVLKHACISAADVDEIVLGHSNASTPDFRIRTSGRHDAKKRQAPHQCFGRSKGEGSPDRRHRSFYARALRDATLRRGARKHSTRKSRIGRRFQYGWNGCGQLCERARAHSMTLFADRFKRSTDTSGDDEGSANSRDRDTTAAVRAGFRSRAAGTRACGRSSPSLR
jgi:hypothetical protein